MEPDVYQSDPRPYILRVQDNGPGIDPKYIPNAFGRVFFGSKFKLRQARGKFGMGGTMAILYGQITTNRPVKIISSTGSGNAYLFELMIDIQANAPIVLSRRTIPAEGVTGTSVELALQGDYLRASSKIHEYFKQTAFVTPYANIIFVDAFGRQFFYERIISSMPPPPKETLPHPYGIDVEALRRLLRETRDETLAKFMCKNFHRVGENIAKRFLEFAGFGEDRDPKTLSNQEVVALVDALHRYGDFLKPDASCLSPIGRDILEAGMRKELQPEFTAISVRPPSAYSGFPFIVEVGLAYGGKVLQPGVKVFRFANRIPLLYDEGSDVCWKVVNQEIDWRRYKVRPEAPIGIIVHVCSTKVPYKTVGKEFLADRPELERELRNAIRETLRQLNTYLSRKGSMEMVKRKINIYRRYLPLIARFSTELSGAKRPPRYRRLLERGSGDEGVREGGEVVGDEAKTTEEAVMVERQTTFEDFG